MKVLVIAIAALTALSGAAFANPQTAGTKPASPAKVAKKATPLVCPVTGDKIASTAKAVGHSVYKGKTYYFCCPMCKPKFDKAPAKYVKNAAQGKFEKM